MIEVKELALVGSTLNEITERCEFLLGEAKVSLVAMDNACIRIDGKQFIENAAVVENTLDFLNAEVKMLADRYEQLEKAYNGLVEDNSRMLTRLQTIESIRFQNG